MTDLPLVAVEAAYRHEESEYPTLIGLNTVEPEAVEWLWPSRIPLGKLTILQGDPGLGKSTLAIDLAARLTTGRPMPDSTDPDTEGSVIFLSAEDGAADTIRPRLDAAGGDPSRVRVLGPEAIPPTFPLYSEWLEDEVQANDVRLVVVDPIMAFLDDSVNSFKDQDIRSALHPLARCAERTGASMVLIQHLRKAGGRAIHRGGGSIGMVAAARSVLLVAPDPDDDDACVLATVKCNLAPESASLRFRLDSTEHGVPRVRWEGASPHRADSLANPIADAGEKSALDDAKAFLCSALEAGPVAVRDITSQARADGISPRTLERARGALGVKSRPNGFRGPRMLSLLTDQSPPQDTSVRHIINTAETGDLGGDCTDLDSLRSTIKDLVRGRPDLDRDQLLAAIPFNEQGRAAPILDEILTDTPP